MRVLVPTDYARDRHSRSSSGCSEWASTSKWMVGRSRVPVRVLRDSDPKHPIEMNPQPADAPPS